MLRYYYWDWFLDGNSSHFWSHFFFFSYWRVNKNVLNLVTSFSFISFKYVYRKGNLLSILLHQKPFMILFFLFYFNSSRCFCTWLCSSLILMLLFIIKIENYREKCSTLIINLMKKFQKEVHGSLLVHVSWNGSADSRFRTPLSWTPPPFPVSSQSQWLRLWPPRPSPPSLARLA